MSKDIPETVMGLDKCIARLRDEKEKDRIAALDYIATDMAKEFRGHLNHTNLGVLDRSYILSCAGRLLLKSHPDDPIHEEENV